MSHTSTYIIFVAFLFLLSTTSSLLCNPRDWRTLHANCWGECVQATDVSSRHVKAASYALSEEAVRESCGSNRDPIPADKGAVMPECSKKKSLKHSRGVVMQRAYCTNVLRPILHLRFDKAHIHGTQTKKTASCNNFNCDVAGQTYEFGQFCQQQNSGEEQDVSFCKPCPPGTKLYRIDPCVHLHADKRTENRICQVRADVDWMKYEGGKWMVKFKASAFPDRKLPKFYEYSEYDDDRLGDPPIIRTIERSVPRFGSRQSLDNLLIRYNDYYGDSGMDEEWRLLRGHGYYRRNKPYVHPKRHQL